MVAQVVGLVEAPGQRLDLPLDIRGTAFQQRVWAALRPYLRQDGDLQRDRPSDRPAESRARRRPGLRRQSACDRDPLPSGGAVGRRPLRLSLGRRAQAQADRSGGGVMKARAPAASLRADPHARPFEPSPRPLSPRERGKRQRRASLLPRGEGGPRSGRMRVLLRSTRSTGRRSSAISTPTAARSLRSSSRARRVASSRRSIPTTRASARAS